VVPTAGHDSRATRLRIGYKRDPRSTTDRPSVKISDRQRLPRWRPSHHRGRRRVFHSVMSSARPADGVARGRWHRAPWPDRTHRRGRARRAGPFRHSSLGRRRAPVIPTAAAARRSEISQPQPTSNQSRRIHNSLRERELTNLTNLTHLLLSRDLYGLAAGYTPHHTPRAPTRRSVA
jgi:hypothetical protein